MHRTTSVLNTSDTTVDSSYGGWRSASYRAALCYGLVDDGRVIYPRNTGRVSPGVCSI